MENKKCNVKIYENGSYTENVPATFLHWGVDYTETRDGVGISTVAIVMLENGQVTEVNPCHVKFDLSNEWPPLLSIDKVRNAAPDLLEVCQRVVLNKDIISPPAPVKGVSEEYADEYEALNRLVRSAEAAIKKATE
jgi:hypothetical protein